jgi:hypothetical protein
MRGIGAGIVILAFGSWLVTAPASSGPSTGQVAVVHGEVRDPEHTELARRVRTWKLVEKVQAQLNTLRLPRRLTLTLRECDGLKEAWFDEDGVTVCYEYLRVNYAAARLRANAGPLPVSADDVLAATLYDAMLHEAAHALIEYLAIPVLGREEDAADQLAAYQMLRRPREETRRLVIGTAFTYVEDIRVLADQGETQPHARTARWKYSGAHATPAQRYYNLLCLAYGADASLFADVVAHDILPRYRARGCEDEFKQVERAWNTLILPHIDSGLAADTASTPWLARAGNPEGSQASRPGR